MRCVGVRRRAQGSGQGWIEVRGVARGLGGVCRVGLGCAGAGRGVDIGWAPGTEWPLLTHYLGRLEQGGHIVPGTLSHEQCGPNAYGPNHP